MLLTAFKRSQTI